MPKVKPSNSNRPFSYVKTLLLLLDSMAPRARSLLFFGVALALTRDAGLGGYCSARVEAADSLLVRAQICNPQENHGQEKPGADHEEHLVVRQVRLQPADRRSAERARKVHH